jgi:hypothetical protein
MNKARPSLAGFEERNARKRSVAMLGIKEEIMLFVNTYRLTTRRLALVGVMALIGCSTQPPHAIMPTVAPEATRATARGAEVATELTTQYKDKRADCGTSNRPAFLCTGVLFRGTTASPAYHSWNPSPGSQQRGGVSFSFLRADSKFNRLAYGYTNGLIFKPYVLAGTGKLNPEVLCAFPVDAWTDGRVNKGCGAHSQFPSVSGPCQAQGITTAQQWATHFNTPSANKNTHSCGFDVSGNGNGTAVSFTVDLAARALIPNESFSQNDELILATWAQMENPTPLPIQAFFYLPGGLAGAQHDQKDYYAQAGTVIPIIAMTLPATAANDATFIYREQDQVAGGNEPPDIVEDFTRQPVRVISLGSSSPLSAMTVTATAGPGMVRFPPAPFSVGLNVGATDTASSGLPTIPGGTARLDLNAACNSVSFEVRTNVPFRQGSRVDFYDGETRIQSMHLIDYQGYQANIKYSAPRITRVDIVAEPYVNGDNSTGNWLRVTSMNLTSR